MPSLCRGCRNDSQGRESNHGRVVGLCMENQVQKGLGKAREIANVQSGEEWNPKWEAGIVMATVKGRTRCMHL